MRRLLPTLVCSLALIAAGCGGDDESASQDTTKQETSASAGGKTATVSMKNIQFQPADITLARGGTVKWTNDESVGHDVTKTGGPGPKFSSGGAGAMQSGDTFQQRFDTAGTVEYVCTVHPNMKGVVTVK